MKVFRIDRSLATQLRAATQSLASFATSFPPETRAAIRRSAGWAAAYAVWIIAFKLLVTTFVTYFLISAQRAPEQGLPRFEDISEVLGSNELTLLGLASLLFVILVRAFNPVTTTTTAEIFTGERFEKRFLPGFLHGAVLATGVALAFVLSGTHRYFGFLNSFEDAPLAVSAIVVRILALAALAYCEEFIFRHKLSRHLTRFLNPVISSVFVAILYCAIKMLQFDLGVMHLITLFLLSVSLSLRTSVERDAPAYPGMPQADEPLERDFVQGAGFLAALLIVFQPLLCMPVLGNEFSGIVFIRYQAALSDTAEPSLQQATLRLLTGGAGGPFSGLAFQILLILDIVRGILRRQRKSA